MTRRESHQPTEGTLDETLGEEACGMVGMVVVGASGHPMKYDQLQILENAVGTQNVRMELDVPTEDGRGWRRAHSSTETQDDHLLNAQWCKDIQKAPHTPWRKRGRRPVKHTTTPNCSLTSIHMEQAISTRRSPALVALSTTLEVA